MDTDQVNTPINGCCVMGGQGSGRRSSFNRKIKHREIIAHTKKAAGKCHDCPEPITDNPWMFDFDHRNPDDKSFAISDKYHSVSTAALYAEMAKCDIVCANCHRRRTRAQQLNGFRTGYKKVNSSDQLLLFDLANI
jgi:hypothetical protein